MSDPLDDLEPLNRDPSALAQAAGELLEWREETVIDEGEERIDYRRATGAGARALDELACIYDRWPAIRSAIECARQTAPVEVTHETSR